MDTASRIKTLLEEHLTVERIEVGDDSDKHRGHRGALESGGGHFVLFLIAREFNNLTPLQRHRRIHDILKPLQAEIHALKITAQAPGKTGTTD